MQAKPLWQRLWYLITTLVRAYSRHQISIRAAGLSYYLLQSLFPLIVCIALMLSGAPAPASGFLVDFEEWLSDTSGLSHTFAWQNPTGLSSVVIFLFSLFLFITSSAGAFRCLSGTAGEISGERRFHGFFGGVISYFFSVVLFLAVYASIGILTLWDMLTTGLSDRLPLPEIAYFLGDMRHVIVFCVFFALCFCLHRLLKPSVQRPKDLLPGTFFTALGCVVGSAFFSHFLSGSMKYTLGYGSLASLILLMIWIYMCGNILLIGMLINDVLCRQR